MTRRGEVAITLVVLAAVLLVSPVRALWVGGPWWSGFALWGLLLVAAGWSSRRVGPP